MVVSSRVGRWPLGLPAARPGADPPSLPAQRPAQRPARRPAECPGAGDPVRLPWRRRCSAGRAAVRMLYRSVSALYGRESIFSKTHTNEFCGKINLARERGEAGCGAKVGRWVGERGRQVGGRVARGNSVRGRPSGGSASRPALPDQLYHILHVSRCVCF